jgi:UDP-N-acetylmuramate dehydrogenase
MGKYFDHKDIEYHEDVNLERYTTIRLRVNGDIALVKSTQALEKLIVFLNENGMNYHLVGWGANQVLYKTSDTLFIKLDFPFDRSYLADVKNEYTLPASVPLNILTSHAQKFGLKGWEVFTGIPASFGGAIFMNAGTALGEIGPLIKSVKLLSKDGSIKTVTTDENSFSYRKNNILKDGEVILEATITHNGLDEEIKGQIKNYLEYRKTTQPLSTRNCGCVFKNFDEKHKAGHFIDSVGLKGLTINGLRISHVHANFIENFNNGTSEDFVDLVELIKYELEVFSGIKFELEAKVY